MRLTPWANLGVKRISAHRRAIVRSSPRESAERPRDYWCEAPKRLFIEGADDAGDEGVADDVGGGEADDGDALDAFEEADAFGEA